MKIYLLRVSETDFLKLCKYLVLYHIQTVTSWRTENVLFNNSHFLVVTDRGSGGITTEEKERLIVENQIATILNMEEI